jgi:Tfp pilus assembly protein PilN
MTRLDIDFAPPNWRRSLHRVPAWAWCTGALGVALIATAAWSGSAALQRQQLREGQLQRAQQRVAAATQGPVPAPQVAIAPAQAAAVNAAILQLNLPWRDLQDALASATPPGIALLALEPDARKRVLKITAETTSSDAMVAYVAQLKQQELFGARVQLLRHEINALDPNKPLRFQLEARWGTP